MAMVDYTKLKNNRKPRKVLKLPLPNGTWLPISAASHFTGYSRQHIRILYFKGRVSGIVVPGTPLLVRVEDVLTENPVC